MPSEGIYLIPHFLLSSVNYHNIYFHQLITIKQKFMMCLVSCHFSFFIFHISKKNVSKKILIAQKSIQQFFSFHFLPSEGVYLLSSVNYHQTKNLWYQFLVSQETFPFLSDPENRPCENDKTQDT